MVHPGDLSSKQGRAARTAASRTVGWTRFTGRPCCWRMEFLGWRCCRRTCGSLHTSRATCGRCAEHAERHRQSPSNTHIHLVLANVLPFSGERRTDARSYHGREEPRASARGVAAQLTIERAAQAFSRCNGLLDGVSISLAPRQQSSLLSEHLPARVTARHDRVSRTIPTICPPSSPRWAASGRTHPLSNGDPQRSQLLRPHRAAHRTSSYWVDQLQPIPRRISTPTQRHRTWLRLSWARLSVCLTIRVQRRRASAVRCNARLGSAQPRIKTGLLACRGLQGYASPRIHEGSVSRRTLRAVKVSLQLSMFNPDLRPPFRSPVVVRRPWMMNRPFELRPRDASGMSSPLGWNQAKFQRGPSFSPFLDVSINESPQRSGTDAPARYPRA